MKSFIVYAHGKDGSAGEAEHYKMLFPQDEVIGFDYRSQTPWEAKKEFFAFFAEKKEKWEIATNFGETLSWDYQCYVRQHPVIWNVPTCILYGEYDNLTHVETVSAFANRHHADLTVMPGGEHWFHTDGQMRFLKRCGRSSSIPSTTRPSAASAA